MIEGQRDMNRILIIEGWVVERDYLDGLNELLNVIVLYLDRIRT